jgi:hypothetical protein
MRQGVASPPLHPCASSLPGMLAPSVCDHNCLFADVIRANRTGNHCVSQPSDTTVVNRHFRFPGGNVRRDLEGNLGMLISSTLLSTPTLGSVV